MKVLLLNEIGSHQIPLLTGLCDHVEKYGIDAELFNFGIGFFYSRSGKKPFLYFVYRFLLALSFRARLKKWLWKYLLPNIVLKMSKRYDVIDSQGLFSKYSMALIPILKSHNKKVKVTLWGSDFYRQAGGSWEEKKICFDNCDVIMLATPQMKTDFLQIYPQYAEKIRIVNFGLTQLELLYNMLKRRKELDGDFLEIPDGKIVIACGYNGNPQQQHTKMIETFAKLPKEMKEELYLIFPMTYALTEEYLSQVESNLNKAHLRYKIITERLSLNHLLTLRIMTDITLNIQETDALAASIQEHLMAGNLVVVGDWLPYSIYEANEVYLRKTSLENLTENIIWAVENYQNLKANLAGNTEKIYQLSSWKYVAERQAKVYLELQ